MLQRDDCTRYILAYKFKTLDIFLTKQIIQHAHKYYYVYTSTLALGIIIKYASYLCAYIYNDDLQTSPLLNVEKRTWSKRLRYSCFFGWKWNHVPTWFAIDCFKKTRLSLCTLKNWISNGLKAVRETVL